MMRKTTYIIIRYFYPADFSRWANLIRRNAIDTEQHVLWTAYNEIKTTTPNMQGMVVISTNGKIEIKAL